MFNISLPKTKGATTVKAYLVKTLLFVSVLGTAASILSGPGHLVGSQSQALNAFQARAPESQKVSIISSSEKQSSSYYENQVDPSAPEMEIRIPKDD
ncbi:MAG: hypothetical protein C5B49_05100 [Bdellovibrio sp.]|nr:MAG: hypothetical protein C5B49_05100 [Bdellovibrio sp.]